LHREKGKKVIKTIHSDILPYCYVLKKDFIRYQKALKIWFPQSKLIDTGSDFYKIEVQIPSDIKEIRETFPVRVREDIKFWEADIPYIRRYMIDKDIKSNGDEQFKKAYVDIECDDRRGVLPDPETDSIISIAIVADDGKEYFKSGDEKEILKWFKDTIKDFDIIIGWNLDRFDRPYLERRCEILGVPMDWKLFQFIDLLFAYKKVKVKMQPSYSLDSVAKLELGRGKAKEKRRRVTDLSPSELKEYNLEDSRFLREIDNKMGITDLFILLAETAGIFIDDTNWNSRIVDSLILRESKKRNLILPSKGKYEGKQSKFTGAIILFPKSGLHKNVICLDFTSLYNRIVQTWNISLETIMNNDSDELIKSPEETFFKKEEGLIPCVIRKFEELREEYKEKRNQFEFGTDGFRKFDKLQYIIKTVLLSFYGVIGQEGSRYYHKSIASTVTSCGRMLIKETVKHTKNLGYDTLYADTDSIFVVVPEGEDPIEVGNKLKDSLNEYYSKLLKEKYNIDTNRIEMKFEKVYEKLLFSGEEKKGIKKRYAGKLIWLEGKKADKIAIVGFEYVRGDQCELTRNLQFDIIKMLLEDASKREIQDKIMGEKTKLFSGEYDNKLILSKGLSKPISEYKQKTLPIQVRIAKMILENSPSQLLGRVQYVITGYKGGLEGVPVIDGKIPSKPSYDYYWNNQILPPIQRIVEGVFGKVELEMRSLDTFFGFPAKTTSKSSFG
jgi:DNA polymerase I